MGYIRGVILLILSLVLLSGCSNTPTIENTTSESTEVKYNSTEDSDLGIESATDFIKNFSQNYPSFELLDYFIGSEENNPIVLVAVAENKESGSSSTLFIVDDSGIGQVGVFDYAIYRQEDGLHLDKNVISVSFDVAIADMKYEIHDYDLAVSKAENQGVMGTLYTSNDVIRTK